MTNEEALKDLFRSKELDPEALTVQEIANKTGLSLATADTKMKAAVDAGTWELVAKKQDNGRVVRAFRVKRS